ncbi:methyltransferase domain-containing protein [Antarctobacter heliothermus]|uniref:Trans-aconitate 2-methyltransferase n=1 Tax=Antarctobacter heliothermus TaxID=74033 RepID=A0A239DN98_9RHOB|nr:methyltransferase domain-containing protein [Antarctobacter heliothermus]SNS33243.1 trans-aconitate 2-methyltransferase [Antarctobacter heliothermus]
MSGVGQNDWDPGIYHRFRGQRLRPALDLLARVGPLPKGDVVDLGCGAGDVASALHLRFCETQKARLIGVDRSPAMMQQARALDVYDRLDEADIALWTPDEAPALIFSNASLHWASDHQTLLPRLVAALAPGGTLAVQVPHQNNAPSHRLWRTLADELCPGRMDDVDLPSVLLPAQYYHLLETMGDVRLWETDYFQKLPPSEDGHPVRCFTEATYARPILQAMPDHESERLVRAYDELIPKAYPLSADGSALFPFRRLFFTVVRAGHGAPAP